MKINWHVLTVMIFLAGILRSDEPSPKKIIDQVEAKLISGKNIKVQFEEMFIWKLAGEDQKIEGELYLQGDSKFCIITEDQKIVSDGVNLYTYDKSANRVLIDRLGQSEDALLPRQILFQYTKNHRTRIVGKEVISGNQCYILEFTHETGEVYFPTVRVWVDEKAWVPRKVEQIDLYENRTIYLLKNVEIGIELEEKQFHFIIPESAEVIDMR
jgi:outer membrane lipoprotein-sorting protein